MKHHTNKRHRALVKKLNAAINKGVKWLDLTLGRKEWIKRIDLTKFYIDDGKVCIMGNVFGDDFFNGSDVEENGYRRFTSFMDCIGGEHYGRAFGFASEQDSGWSTVQELWVKKLKALKKRK